MILNIGLGTSLTAAAINMGKAMQWLSYRVRPDGFSCAINGSKEEYVLVVKCAPWIQLPNFNQLAELLKQDCIAVFDESTKEGYLIGPRALNWGAFNLRKFLRS